MLITHREEEGLPNEEEFSQKLLSQEEIFFSNRLQEVERDIEAFLEDHEGQDISDNQKLTALKASRDLYKKQLHKIEVENMLSQQNIKNKTLVSRIY